jgi:hypothetical protein
MPYASGSFATKFSGVQNLAAKIMGKKQQNQNDCNNMFLTFSNDMCCSIHHKLLHSKPDSGNLFFDWEFIQTFGYKSYPF